MATLLETWRASAYNPDMPVQKQNMFWANYFNYEKGIMSRS